MIITYFAIYSFSLFKMASCPIEENEIDSCIKEVGIVIYLVFVIVFVIVFYLQ